VVDGRTKSIRGVKQHLQFLSMQLHEVFFNSFLEYDTLVVKSLQSHTRPSFPDGLQVQFARVLFAGHVRLFKNKVSLVDWSTQQSQVLFVRLVMSQPQSLGVN
jgi:hypothetical protein